MSFSVYILWSRSLGKYYIGQTSDLVDQLLQHNGGQSPDTKSGIPWKLMYHEDFRNFDDAATRAEKIRSMKNKSSIEALINQ